MKSYPSIPHVSHVEIGMPCLVFNKIDGSNLKYEWNSKSGWYKFGTRRRLFDKSDPEYGQAIPLFMNQFSEPLEQIFRKTLKTINVTVYCEFLGPHSFAGQHDVKTLNNLGFDVSHNEPKQLVMFDVNIHKKGFIDPETFVNLFSGIVPVTTVLHKGILTEKLVDEVRNGEFSSKLADSPVKEGVICKGGTSHKIWRCKIKTNAYLEELKKRFNKDWQNFV